MGYRDWLIFVKHISDAEYVKMTDDEQEALYEEYLRS